MTQPSVWDDPDFATGEFYDFDNPGDVASGVIKVVRTHTFDDGKKVPQVVMLDDATQEDKVLTAGQIRLKMTLVEQRPMPGDHLRVTYTQKEPRAGGKTLKHFDVQITRNYRPDLAAAGAAVTASAPPAPAAPPQPDPTQYAPPAPAQPYPTTAPPQYAPPVAAPAAPAQAPAAPQPPSPPAVDPAAAQAAIAALSPEQRAALGL